MGLRTGAALAAVVAASLVAGPAVAEGNSIRSVTLQVSDGRAEIGIAFEQPPTSKRRLIYTGRKLIFLFPDIGFSGDDPAIPGVPFRGTRIVSDHTGSRVEVMLDRPARGVVGAMAASRRGDRLSYTWSLASGAAAVSTAEEPPAVASPPAPRRSTDPARRNAGGRVEAQQPAAAVEPPTPTSLPGVQPDPASSSLAPGFEGRPPKAERASGDVPAASAAPAPVPRPEPPGSAGPAPSALVDAEARTLALRRETSLDGAGGYFSLFGVVGLVAVGGLWLTRRRKARLGGDDAIDFLGARSIGPKQSVVLLRVMGKHVLVGSSEKGVVMLSALDRDGDAPTATAGLGEQVAPALKVAIPLHPATEPDPEDRDAGLPEAASDDALTSGVVALGAAGPSPEPDRPDMQRHLDTLLRGL